MTDDLYAQRMSSAEAVMLCRMAKAACPQQQFDQYTPDMWHELLGDLRFEDAKDALVSVVRAQPFVSPAEIRDQVKKVRRQRLLDFGYVVPPAELASNPEAEGRWIYETNQAIADGRLKKGDKPERPQELLARVMPDWDKVLPSPEPVRRAQITAEKRRAKTPEFAQGMADARAELDARRPVPPPDAAEPDPPTAALQRSPGPHEDAAVAATSEEGK